MAARRFPREVLACSLIAVFAASSMAQSLGDLAREQRREKASAAHSNTTKPQTFSNLDNPPPQGTAPGRQTAGHAAPSGPQPLQIDSPTDGTVVSPGEIIGVRVTSPTGKNVAFVVVRGDDPLPRTELRHSLPAEFLITIPSDIRKAGRYSLTAMGRTTAGELVEDFIDIDVERPDMPVSLTKVNGNDMYFGYPGETSRILMLATFSDGKMLEVTESPNLAFQSTDTKIVTMDATGSAVAVATGAASIIASYRTPDGPDVQLKIPVTVERFPLTLAPTSLDFGEVAVGRSASLSLTVTNNTMSEMEMRIKAIDVTGPYSAAGNCMSSSLAVDASCEISVTFTPAAAGPNPGTLSIYDSSGGGPSKISLSGIGVK